MTRYLESVIVKIKDLPDDDLAKFIDFFHVNDRRAWLEDASGRVILGEPWAGMTAMERRPERLEKRFEMGEATVLVLKQPEPAIVAMFEIQRDGKPAILCFNWRRGPRINYLPILAQGAIGLVCLSFFLSLWTARRISRPLSELRDKVVKIYQGDLALKLSENGEEEVADVSKAINGLTENLSLHIEGMKQLMANMSHEMRSTVTNIGLSLEITEEAFESVLSMQPAIPERERILRNISQARLELEILENMVASGLLGGKLDLRHEILEFDPLDFSSLCRQVIDRHSNRAAHGGISLSGQVEPGLWIIGDEILLDRLLANILDNAIKYTSFGGQIELALVSGPDFLTISCLNTHPPLTDEQLKCLCLPYYRVEQGQIQGSGLGLYLARRITDLHGGKFTVENDQQGILFSIYLPLPNENQFQLSL
ncbi:MAG: HAMP domain-containing histidine kinase [Deltaproteobacteria bacterium]|jgi:two-component system sensor histidine kinase CpxA|nr:HAMP domain-containing histidine kinase [Deltaproteobacteria bacterium]